MPKRSASIELTASQAACLDALRAGFDTKTRIAIQTGQDLRAVSAALKHLEASGLIRRVSRTGWQETRKGAASDVTVVPDSPRRRGGKGYGRVPKGSTAARLLAMVKRPMRGNELVERLGVSRQRVHQLVVRLHALGKVRLGDSGSPLHIVARSGVPVVFLGRTEERVMSALPNDVETSASKVAVAAGISSKQAGEALLELCRKNLVQEAGIERRQTVYRLTKAGRRHFQRNPSARHARPLPLEVRSDRVRQVLSHLAKRKRARSVEIAEALSLPKQSLNALMQYLKRKGLVANEGDGLVSPYVLTNEGRDTLAAMSRGRRE